MCQFVSGCQGHEVQDGRVPCNSRFGCASGAPARSVELRPCNDGTGAIYAFYFDSGEYKGIRRFTDRQKANLSMKDFKRDGIIWD